VMLTGPIFSRHSAAVFSSCDDTARSP
jgi:hypothetical protein